MYLEFCSVPLTSPDLACHQPWVHILKGRMRREVLVHPSHTPPTRNCGGITDTNTSTRWLNDTAEIGQVGMLLVFLRYLSLRFKFCTPPSSSLERIIHMLFPPCLCHHFGLKKERIWWILWNAALYKASRNYILSNPSWRPTSGEWRTLVIWCGRAPIELRSSSTQSPVTTPNSHQEEQVWWWCVRVMTKLSMNNIYEL